MWTFGPFKSREDCLLFKTYKSLSIFRELYLLIIPLLRNHHNTLAFSPCLFTSSSPSKTFPIFLFSFIEVPPKTSTLLDTFKSCPNSNHLNLIQMNSILSLAFLPLLFFVDRGHFYESSKINLLSKFCS